MITGRFLTLFSAVLASVKFANADLTDGYGFDERADDPCATIGGQTWAAPADVRACFKSYAVNETVKANVSRSHRTSNSISPMIVDIQRLKTHHGLLMSQ